MKKISVFILLFLGNFQFLFAQDNCERSSCKWEFFELEETVRGEVICHEYLPQNFSCRGRTFNTLISLVNNNYQITSFCPNSYCLSIMIMKVDQDTIRVLSYIGEKYDEGTEVYVIPDQMIRKEENLNFIFHAVGKNTTKKKKGWKKEYKKALAQLPDRFDEVVLKTTTGSLSDKSDYERRILGCESRLVKPITHNSFQCAWEFFELEKPLNGTIVKYEAQKQPCQILAQGSLAIISIENTQDTIRVLDVCNSSTFKEGEAVIIEAGTYQCPLSIPYSKIIKDEQVIYQTNEFDASILRTTYGEIMNKE